MKKLKIKKGKMTIVSDLDGTLIDFVEGFLKFYNERHNSFFRKEQINFYDISKCLGISFSELISEFDSFYDSQEFRELKPLEGSAEGIRMIAKQISPLFLCTSRPKKLKEATFTTISKYFNGDISRVYFCERMEKIKQYLELGANLVIEDDLSAVLLAAEKEIPSILIDQKGNQDGNLPSLVYRAGDYRQEGSQWADIIKLLKNGDL
jgi:uncharacterized HAD superfamily protein